MKKYRNFKVLTLLIIWTVVCPTTVLSADNEENNDKLTGQHDCRSDPERGDCTEFKPHWFYNITSKRCEQFWYGGCGGNGNNYETQEGCQKQCRHADRRTDNIVISEDDAKVKETVRKTSPALSKCMQSSDRGTYCSKWAAKWYFNSDSGVCERFWYGGCDGNENRFDDKESCMQACTRSEDVCKMPVVMGNCRERLPRWYYVSAIQQCRFFEYSGCNGNGNRFMTKIDCERQCLNEREAFESRDCRSSHYGCCPDQVTSAQGNNNEGCPNACKETRYGCCDDDMTPAQGPEQEGCEVIEISSGDGVPCGETEYGCCPDRETAATGPNQAGCGGVTVVTEKPDGDITVDVPGQCKQPSELGTCRDNMVVMWFYNTTSSRCEMFWYGGCNGNQNRFKSEKECLTICREVVKEEPDNTEVKIPVCDQPKEIGPCRSLINRWFFNKDSRQCEEFGYGGCRGNQNNFEDRATCERYCRRGTPVTKAGQCPRITVEEEGCSNTCYYDGDCPGSDKCCSTSGGCSKCYPPADNEITLTPEEVCDQDKEIGPCKAALPRYYYNRVTDDCESFNYGGCRGNKNNFESYDLCKRYCRRRIEPTRRPSLRQNICELRPALGPCDRNLTKFFYDINTLTCKTFTYGGCLGNHNNFATESKCMSYCALRRRNVDKEEMCKQNFEQGSCRGSYARYYYDARQGRCLQFNYGGCQGNDNNFPNDESCMNACRGVRIDDRIVDDRRPRPQPRPTIQPPKEDNTAEGREEDVCSLPLQTPCSTNRTGPFWYYDRQTGMCREVPDGECNNNRNNFQSRGQCEGYCNRDRVCMPLYYTSNIRCLAIIPSWTYNHQTGRCERFDYGGCGGSANNFNSEDACRRKCEERVIISAVTDAPEVASPAEVCAMPEDSGNCLAYMQQWRYDTASGRCVQFEWGGCGGNKNNFDSREACESSCSRRVVCQVFEEPEIDCFAYIRRWRYDPTSNQCENFIYGGCGGNANNFETFETCENKCIQQQEETRDRDSNEVDNRVSSWRDICLMKYNAGPCDQRVQKWHYNAATRSCETFTYGGCLGNHNNFESEDQCLTYCGNVFGNVVPPTEDPEEVVGSGDVTTDPSGVDVCHLASETGVCRALINAWYYNSLEGECQRFVYGGCGGNANRFPSQEQCERQCNDRDVCRLSSNSGMGYNYTTRYYFDYSAQKCRSFVYGGEDGNANNFETEETCLRKCDSLIRRVPVSGMKPGACPMLFFPKSSARCLKQCNEDGNCAGHKKCCPLGCNFICLDPDRNYMPPKGGECPARKRSDGLLGACAPQCRDDSQCSGNQKCCYSGCGYKCVDPVSAVKVGECPARKRSDGLLGACAPQCRDDSQCSGNQKCCYSGCGYKCVDPVSAVKVGECPARKSSDGLLGACAPQCRDDSQCSGNQKCCYSGCGYKCVDPVSAVKVGECPARKRSDGLLGACAPQCRDDSQCSGNQKCCYSGCGYKCVDPVSEQTGPKAGYCPARVDWQGLLGACAPRCQDDRDCEDTQKCCHHGCGLQCVNPVADEPYQMDAPMRVDADTLNENSIHVTWSDPSLGREQLIQDRRFYTIRYFSYQHGQYNYMNVTDLRGHVNGLTSDTEYHFSVRANNPPYLSEWSTDVMNTTMARVLVKSGSCPALEPNVVGTCVNMCDTDSDCSGSEKCCSNGCGRTCTYPRGYDVCSLPMERGECSEWIVRWYYTRDENGLGVCKRFWFGGCEDQGNGNRFENKTDCEAACGTGVTEAPRTPRPYDCRRSIYGCCEDRYTPAVDREKSNCPENQRSSDEIVPAVPGESVTLRCRSYSNVTWYRDGKLVESNDRRRVNNDGTIVVFQATIVDDGVYACHVYYGSPQPTIYRYTLQVRNSSDETVVVPIGIIDESPDTIIVKPNHMAFLHCEAYGNPKPTVTWQKNGEPLRTGARYETFSNGTLLIRRATADDIDRYTCIADNRVTPSVSRTIGLNLREMLVARIENDNGRVTEGGIITLTCEGRGYPTPTVTWEKMGQPIRTGGNVFISSEGKLVVREATLGDTGTYSCIVANSEEKIETSTSVQVIRRIVPDEDDKCEDKTSLMKCRLIVTARLCGYTMYSKICCNSCKSYYNGRQ